MSDPRSSPRFAWVRGWQFIVIAWLLAFASRPFLLGFYDDDWAGLLIPAQRTAAFSWERLAFFMDLYANRPALGVVTFLLSSVCGESSLLWHSAVAVLTLIAALVVRMFLASVLRLCGCARGWAADAGAALWVVFPWTLGSTARPIQSPTIVAVAFFGLCGAVLFERWRRGRPSWGLPCVLFLLSCLTYEALYGQFVVLFLIGGLCGVHRRIGLGRLFRSFLAFSLVQGVAVACNRLVPLFNSFAPTKRFCPIWREVVMDNLHRLRFFIGHSARELSPLVELLLLAVLAACCLCLACKLLRRDERMTALRSGGALAVCGLGAFIGILVLSVADYRLKGVGLGSRTTMAFSFWLAAALAVGFGNLLPRPAALRTATLACTAVLGGLLAFSAQARLREWAEAWEIEQEILTEAPTAELAAALPDAVVLYMGPERHKGVRVFGYMNNIDYAMQYAHPQRGSLRFYPAARDGWVTTWDGRHFEQRLRFATAWERRPVWNECETSEVWIWLRETGEVFRIEPPFTFTTDSTYPWPYDAVACPWPYDPLGR